MATTAQNVIDRAGERSNLNDTSLIAEAQMLDYITQFERRIYLNAARQNPDYFGGEGNTGDRADETSTWNLTSAPNSGLIAAVSRIEVSSITGTVSGVSTGDVVNVISIREPEAELDPRAYLRGRTLHPYSGLGPDGSNFVDMLKVFYSELSADVTATSQNLTLPDEYGDLVVLPLAKLMAVADQREAEAAVIDQEFNLAFSNFLTQISVYDEVTVRPLDGVSASSANLNLQGV